MMRPTDRLLAPSRGSAEEAIAYAKKAGAYRLPDVIAYITEVYRVAPIVLLDAAIPIGQAVHETDDFHSQWWVQRLNPAGIGITGDPAQNAASHTWTSGGAAARSQIAHLLLYATGSIDGGNDTNPISPDDDPRYWDYFEAYGRTVQAQTIAELAGKWAVDQDYAAGICSRGNAIFPGIPDQGGTTVPLTIDVDLTNRMNVPLRDKLAFITVHNTGNSVPRQSERIFVNGGGGTEGVAYHFAVDETGATQIMPLWKRGVHSGNAEGNATSIAIEMCELREPWSDIKENTAQLLAAIVLRDPRIRFDSSAYEFSLDRVREHRDWPGANPGCPRRLIATDGGVEQVVARARAIVAGDDPNPVVVVPHAVGGKSGENWVDESGNEWVWLYRMVNPANPVQTYEYANVLSGKGPVLPADKRVRAYRAVAANGPDETPEIWVTTKLGWRFLMSDALKG